MSSETAAAKAPRSRFRPFPIRIHSSWGLLAGVVAALFAALYARRYPELGTMAAVGYGLATGVGLLGSVLVHELAHAIAALRSGLTVSGISLRVFGGVTELREHPKTPATELRIALAGPVATLMIGGVLASVALLPEGVLPQAAVSTAFNLGLMNGLLLLLNLIPAVPLDGGRMLRAVLWAIWGSPAAGTRAVAVCGRSFGLLMVGFGVLALLSVGVGGVAQLAFGTWFILMGIRLRRVSRQVTGHLWFSEQLRGVTAAHLLDYRILPVQRTASGHEMAALETPNAEIPVLHDEELVGSVRLSDLYRRPVSEWDEVTAEQLMSTDIVKQVLGPEDAAIRALPILTGKRRSVAVLDEGQLVGIVTVETLSRQLALTADA